MEIDLRGLRVDDGLAELERQLDAAYLNGMPFVRIIHGKGTGAMKKAVREALHTNPHVKRFEGGKDEEGGEGVTIAFLHVGFLILICRVILSRSEAEAKNLVA